MKPGTDPGSDPGYNECREGNYEDREKTMRKFPLIQNGNMDYIIPCRITAVNSRRTYEVHTDC